MAKVALIQYKSAALERGVRFSFRDFPATELPAEENYAALAALLLRCARQKRRAIIVHAAPQSDAAGEGPNRRISSKQQPKA
jgi:hypothetical protein